MTTATGSQRVQLLTFVLDGDEYAVDILRVREIIRYTPPTRVPGMPASVRGLINLRGRVVPVIDLSARFGFPQSDITARTSIVMVDTTSPDGEVVIGIVTDAVTAVFELTTEQIQPPPSFGTSVGSEFLDGMAEIGDQKFAMVLNIDRVLGADVLVKAPE